MNSIIAKACLFRLNKKHAFCSSKDTSFFFPWFSLFFHLMALYTRGGDGDGLPVCFLSREYDGGTRERRYAHRRGRARPSPRTPNGGRRGEETRRGDPTSETLRLSLSLSPPSSGVTRLRSRRKAPAFTSGGLRAARTRVIVRLVTSGRLSVNEISGMRAHEPWFAKPLWVTPEGQSSVRRRGVRTEVRIVALCL